MKQKRQLEFGISTTTACPSSPSRSRRLNPPEWWFLQMRLAVERARIPTSALPGRPSPAQAALAAARRH